MADKFNSYKEAFDALSKAIEAVSKEHNGNLMGANDEWLKNLASAHSDDETEKKVETLIFLDKILRSSIPTTLQTGDDVKKALGLLVTETRGYQDLTERFFSDLRKPSGEDNQLEDAAVQKRSELIEVLNQVQNWLLSQDGGSSPSEFDACTEQFLIFMGSNSSELDLTRQLFRDQTLPESDLKIDLQKLTGAWGKAISSFVENAQDTDGDDPLEIGDPATIANFLCIHERIETLYERIGNVSLIN